MEQQTQQPIQEAIESKPPVETNTSTGFAKASARRAGSMRSWKYIAIIVVLGLVVGGGIWLQYEFKQQSFREPLSVVNEDQVCELDTDCVIVDTNCSSCECGVPVNKVHQQKYKSQYEILCKNYRGPIVECNFDCSTLFPRCINNRCALSAEKSKDDVSTWQT